jgi:hypothetical protein
MCSMTWGSASADRSIIVLKPLPRTSVPAHSGQAHPAHRCTANGALRRTGRTTPPGYDDRRSSDLRPYGSTGTRQPAPFGGPSVASRRNRKRGPPRRLERPVLRARLTSPRGMLHWRASAHRAVSHRDGPRKRRSSELRERGRTGQGTRTSSEAPAPHLGMAWDHLSGNRSPASRGRDTATRGREPRMVRLPLRRVAVGRERPRPTPRRAGR